jgi:hypothetical protein
MGLHLKHIQHSCYVKKKLGSKPTKSSSGATGCMTMIAGALAGGDLAGGALGGLATGALAGLLGLLLMSAVSGVPTAVGGAVGLLTGVAATGLKVGLRVVFAFASCCFQWAMNCPVEGCGGC